MTTSRVERRRRQAAAAAATPTLPVIRRCSRRPSTGDDDGRRAAGSCRPSWSLSVSLRGSRLLAAVAAVAEWSPLPVGSVGRPVGRSNGVALHNAVCARRDGHSPRRLLQRQARAVLRDLRASRRRRPALMNVTRDAQVADGERCEDARESDDEARRSLPRLDLPAGRSGRCHHAL